MTEESELAKKVEATARGLWAALTTVRPQVEGEEDYEYLDDLGAATERKGATTLQKELDDPYEGAAVSKLPVKMKKPIIKASMKRERIASQNVFGNNQQPI